MDSIRFASSAERLWGTLACQKEIDSLRRQQTTNQRSLHAIAVEFSEYSHLILVLDALRDDLHLQAVSYRHDRLHTRITTTGLRELMDEGAVDLMWHKNGPRKFWFQLIRPAFAVGIERRMILNVLIYLVVSASSLITE